MVRLGPVTLEDGSQADLLDYALSHQNDLALKPTLPHGGNGVPLGWHADTSPRPWAERGERPACHPAPDPAGPRAVPGRGRGTGAVDCRLTARAVRHRVITIPNGPLTIRCSGPCSACCSGRCRAAGHAEFVTTGSGLSQS